MLDGRTLVRKGSIVLNNTSRSCVSLLEEGDNRLLHAGEEEDKRLLHAGQEPYLIFVISFTQAAFLNSKFYTRKLTKNTPKHRKMSLKSKIYAVFVFNLENFTPDRIFLHGHRPWCP